MGYTFPDDRKYTTEHEWAKADGNVVTVGITDFAASQLGDIVYLELPSVGDEVTKEQPFGVVESVKSVSDMFAPVSGKVIEVNEALIDSPEKVNEDPYGEAWMVKIETPDPAELEDLMAADEYEELCRDAEH